MRIEAILIVMFALSGCFDSDNLNSPQRWFSTHQIGSGADFGVMHDRNELVITVFGFVDDASVCQDIINQFNKMEPGTYSCEQLNQ